MSKIDLLKGPSINRNISLPQALDKALVQQARVEDRPISRVVRRALIQYLEAGNGQDDKEPD